MSRGIGCYATGAALALLVMTLPFSCAVDSAPHKVFDLWQLPSQGPKQSMSYVLEGSGGRRVVIDGGNTEDATYLSRFVGGEVDAWFITHPHPDHIDALTEILEKNLVPVIHKIYWSPPSAAVLAADQHDAAGSVQRFLTAVQTHGEASLIEVQSGLRINVDSLEFEVLSIASPELPLVNDSSMVLRVNGVLPVLFLGDLQEAGGTKLLANLGNGVRAFVVQVAHHGQDGVNQAFYQAVNPTIALWPTPQWLWDNVGVDGSGTGPYRTAETRAWLKSLGVGINLVSKDGISALTVRSDGTYVVSGTSSEP